MLRSTCGEILVALCRSTHDCNGDDDDAFDHDDYQEDSGSNDDKGDSL